MGQECDKGKGMIKKVRIDYSKRTSPGTLTTICSAKGNILYDRNAANHRIEDRKKKTLPARQR